MQLLVEEFWIWSTTTFQARRWVVFVLLWMMMHRVRAQTRDLTLDTPHAAMMETDSGHTFIYRTKKGASIHPHAPLKHALRVKSDAYCLHCRSILLLRYWKTLRPRAFDSHISRLTPAITKLSRALSPRDVPS